MTDAGPSAQDHDKIIRALILWRDKVLNTDEEARARQYLTAFPEVVPIFLAAIGNGIPPFHFNRQPRGSIQWSAFAAAVEGRTRLNADAIAEPPSSNDTLASRRHLSRSTSPSAENADRAREEGRNDPKEDGKYFDR